MPLLTSFANLWVWDISAITIDLLELTLHLFSVCPNLKFLTAFWPMRKNLIFSSWYAWKSCNYVINGLKSCQPSRKIFSCIIVMISFQKQGEKVTIFDKTSKCQNSGTTCLKIFFIIFEIKNDALAIPYKESSFHVEFNF